MSNNHRMIMKHKLSKELVFLSEQLAVEIVRSIAGNDNVKINEMLKYHTSFKVGGPADILVTPSNADQIVEIIGKCRAKAIPVFIMGNGTNLIILDSGIRGVVVKITERMSAVSVHDDTIKAESGILLSRLAKVALEHELTGIEFASGIPGTLGGAVTMNAGAYGHEIKDVLFCSTYIDSQLNVKELSNEQHEFAHRSSFIQKTGGVVIKSTLKLQKGNKADIKAYMDDLNRQRREKQPLEMPSAGSVFKRPTGYYAGKLIEDCELKGFKIGGAEVSCKHSGFIVNTGDATAKDIINLITHVQTTVKHKFGVDLETEVKIVGEE